MAELLIGQAGLLRPEQKRHPAGLRSTERGAHSRSGGLHRQDLAMEFASADGRGADHECSVCHCVFD